MAFDDHTCREAIDRYMTTIRSDAPYLPSNIEYIAVNNGLVDAQGTLVDAVRNVVFSASYMVFGLGDVFLGAPCAIPVDPRHRLVVQKYNPARTYTPEGAVGLGGAFLCIYGMDSPGMNNTWHRSIRNSKQTHRWVSAHRKDVAHLEHLSQRAACVCRGKPLAVAQPG